MSDILPPTSLAEIDDENFKNLLSQWVDNIDELKTMQEVCFK